MLRVPLLARLHTGAIVLVMLTLVGCGGREPCEALADSKVTCQEPSSVEDRLVPHGMDRGDLVEACQRWRGKDEDLRDELGCARSSGEDCAAFRACLAEVAERHLRRP